ncbi:MAG: DUF4864 domain-containing protein [Rhizobiaceae bacterium]
MPRWLKITLIVTAIVAAVIAAIVYLVISWTSVLVEPVARQLAALKAGDMDAAYAETSEAFRQSTTKEAFGKFVDEYPILKDAADHSFPNRNIKNNEGYLRGSLTSSSGGVTPIEYRLVKENGFWKIIYINVNPSS